MAGKVDFSAEEWETLQKGVTGAAMLVSLADRGFFDTFKEVGALAKHLSEARTKSTSPLIKEVAEVRGTGFAMLVVPETLTSVERVAFVQDVVLRADDTATHMALHPPASPRFRDRSRPRGSRSVRLVRGQRFLAPRCP